MKKVGIALLCMLLIFTGCGKTQKLSGKIAHIYGATLLIAGDDGELYSAAVGHADTGGEKLSAGQSVELSYAGEIDDTYPAQLGEVKEIRVLEKTGNLIDVFVAAIKEILQQDPQPMEILAYDFGTVELLTEGEQQAVGYICWTELDAEPVFGTREELAEQGIILQNGGEESLPNGWLLSFAVDEEDSSLLQISLWRNDEMKEEYTCRFTEEAGEWHYALAEKP